MFSSQLQDVEANTVRLKEHEQAVLVLEKSPRASTLGSIKYTCFEKINKYIHKSWNLSSSSSSFFCFVFVQVHCDLRHSAEDS